MDFKKSDVLIIVDMQNDFISGSLANPDAEAIVEPICQLVKEFPGNIICTRDTHYENYLKTAEGKKLPVEHCIFETAGWCVDDRIQKALRGKDFDYEDKNTFGTLEWEHSDLRDKTIYMVGTCTDICVVSNALILKATYPNANLKVIGNLCAGLTKEKHKAALDVMSSCQIDVVYTEPQLED